MQPRSAQSLMARRADACGHEALKAARRSTHCGEADAPRRGARGGNRSMDRA